MSKNKPKITKEVNIAELIEKYPFVSEVLLSFGLHCVGCFASHFDTLEEGAKIHSMDEGAIKEMVNEINKVIDNPKLLNE